MTAGLAFAVLGMAGAVASIGASRGSMTIGLRRLVIIATLGAAAFNALVAMAPTPTLVLVTLFGVGLCQGAVASCTAALLSIYAPANRQATAFGVATSAQVVSMGSGPLLGGLLASVTTLGTPFLGASLILVGAACLALTLGPAPLSDPTLAD